MNMMPSMSTFHMIKLRDIETEEKAMERKCPIKIVEVKKGKTYVEDFRLEGADVYKHLSCDLIFKYIHKSPMCKSVKRRSNYDGTQTIVVTYDNGVRSTYIVEN